MWPKFGNYKLSFIRIWPEKPLFFEEWPWFKFNNLGLALGTNLKFDTSMAQRLKLKFEKFWWFSLVEIPPPSHTHPEYSMGGQIEN